MRSRLPGLLAALLLAVAPAAVEAKVYYSRAEALGVAFPEAERVEILIDVTSSMEAATEPGPGRHVAARAAAVRLVTALPGNSFIGLHALGVAGGDECNPAFRTGHSGAGEEREDDRSV